MRQTFSCVLLVIFSTCIAFAQTPHITSITPEPAIGSPKSDDYW